MFMKALVAFYSRTGTTKKAAVEIARLLKADVDEIIDKKNRKGAVGYMLAGRDATLKKLTAIETKKDASKYDLVVIGTPVWAFTVSSPVRTYLTQNKGRLKRVAFFCTEDGSGSQRAFKAMSEICGNIPKAHLALRTKDVWKGNVEEKIKEFVENLG
jgi:flavodoxin